MPKRKPDYDIFIIGGGINGVSIARDAAGRGFKVGLCEKGDFASKTSSASTKLIHGGLRYLEFYEFKMVREALKEREVLMDIAPHIIYPMHFILPHVPSMRPKWMIYIGLFLYDHLARRKTLKASKLLSLKHHPHQGLSKDYTHGFEYADCWVEDARFVILNAMDAQDRGADLFRDIEFIKAEPDTDNPQLWCIHLGDKKLYTRYLVNATGAHMNSVGQSIGNQDYKPRQLRLVQGSHIVVRSLFDSTQSLILQMSDERIIFMIPYEKNYTLIGTTDTDITEEGPEAARLRKQEIVYLIEGANQYLPESKKISEKDIVWTYSGIRPLVDEDDLDPQTLSRDYELQHIGDDERPQLLTVYGGKLTTSRYLAEEAVNQMAARLNKEMKAWTTGAHLPGGDFNPSERDQILRAYQSRYAFIDESIIERLFTAYGTRLEHMLEDCQTPDECGESFGGGVYQCELDYAIENEWVRTGEDFLYRRSKLGLHLTDEQKKKIDQYISQYIRKKSQ